ncbi:MAG: phosphopantetheine-binding protein [Pseudodonghicola sp.]
MIEWGIFSDLLRKYAKVQEIDRDDILFGSGIDISSIGFTEFIMELEEECDLDIDIDDLDASIQTVGQLYDRLNAA